MAKTDFQEGRGLVISDIVKEYPDMLKIVIYHNDYMIPTGSRDFTKKKKAKDKKEDSIHRSLRRSKSVIQDIMLSNRFDLWCTFTLNCRSCYPKCDNKPCICLPDDCKRYDIAYARRVLSNWFRNQKKHSPNLQFLAVPEYHKNGAIHFHCLMSNFNGQLKETSKKTKYGQTIYNATGYYSGFTEFVRIGERFDSQSYDEDYKRVAKYLTKYITKDMPMISGRRRYLVSEGLNRPIVRVNGVSRLRLHQVVRGHEPSYIDRNLEVQYHPRVGIVSAATQSRLF